MRPQFIAVAILLVAASAASADTLSVFVSDPAYVATHSTTSENGVPVNHSTSDLSGGVGLAWDHAWNKRWSTDASVTWDHRHALVSNFDNTFVTTKREGFETYPIDVMMKYHFLNESRWTPYVSAGLHYVNAPDLKIIVFQQVAGGGLAPVTFDRFGNRLSAQVGVGTSFRITPRVGLQFDLKRQVRQNGIFYDPLTRGSFGVNFKF